MVMWRIVVGPSGHPIVAESVPARLPVVINNGQMCQSWAHSRGVWQLMIVRGSCCASCVPRMNPGWE